MVWYSHLFKNFPQCVVIHPVKGFGIVNKAEIDVFRELSCFSYDPMNVGSLVCVLTTSESESVSCSVVSDFLLLHGLVTR